MKIPKCMSTQHPDNVNSPFFAENTELGGEDEVQEAYYAFSHLGCDEQMWDCEGKEVDNYVVKKLLTRYGPFFGEKKLGRDVFITLRVPNPTIEKTETKIILETLESIPRSCDAARLFYGKAVIPIFEVILPMTLSAADIDRVYHYYREFVVGKQHQSFGRGGLTVARWIGEFKPETINVIPLFEDSKRLLNAHRILKEYLRGKELTHQRVFLARSDPAMNYGLVSAVLLNKIALQRLSSLAREIGIAIYPIVGVGSAPFRGNLRPETVERVAREYPSAQTFTIQSSFKYDNPHQKVQRAIAKLKKRRRGRPLAVDEERCLEIIRKYRRAYQKQIPRLAPVINKLARFIPSRRKRRLHIGLFGYSRNVNGVCLPRAIGFTAALYSIGLPPEILGLDALSDADLRFLRSVYINLEDDLRDALRFFNPETAFSPQEIREAVSKLSLNVPRDREHREITEHIARSLQGDRTDDLTEHILRAASLRGFLG